MLPAQDGDYTFKYYTRCPVATDRRTFLGARSRCDMSLDSLSDEWVVWNEEQARIVLAFRPDVFDGGDLPAACLPTIYVTRGRRDRRPGGERVGENWYVTLYLEPDVDCGTDSYDSRGEATAAAVMLAETFANGDIDYRSVYQVPREAYFERLDELVGGE